MMKKPLIAFKLLSLATTLLLTLPSLAGNCPVCDQAEAVLKRMSEIAPDPLNGNTIREQTQIINESFKIVKPNLNDKGFTATTSRALTKLIVKTVPYDNSPFFMEENIQAFKRLYAKPSSLLKSTLEDLQKSGEISSDEKNLTLDTFGLLQSKTAKPKK